MKKKLLTLLLAAAMVLSLVACGEKKPAPGKDATATEPVVILHTNDVHGAIEGYAKVAAAEKERWDKLTERYFAASEQITLGVLIVDARHAPTALDIVMERLFRDSGCPYVVVANKLDKLKKSELEPNMERIRSTLALAPNVKLIPFSAEKGTGRAELVGVIAAACGE